MEEQVKEFGSLCELLEDLDREGITGIDRARNVENFLMRKSRLYGKPYGGFEVSEFPGLEKADRSHVQMILDDLQIGGYMGVKEKTERLESGMEYNRQLMRKQKSALQYTLYMIGWKIKSGLTYMFPTITVLLKLYPVAEKHSMLIPVLWLWQACSFPFKKILSGALKRDVRTVDSNMTQAAKKRIEMFQTLEMI